MIRYLFLLESTFNGRHFFVTDVSKSDTSALLTSSPIWILDKLIDNM